MNKKLVIGSALATLAIGVLIPVASSISVSAYGGVSGDSNLIDSLVKKFNLNKNDVQKIFDENKTTMETERETTQATKLKTAVSDGKITQAQADKITAKLAEMKTEREANHTAMESKTEAERETFMETKKTELDNWAKENNIDVSYLMMGGGRGHEPRS